MLVGLRILCKKEIVNIFSSQIRYLNSNTASITKIHRKIYSKTYPCMMVQSDGSTINFKYHEPRKIITLPLDLATLTETERLARIERRKPKIKVKIEEDIKDTYNAKKYLNYIKSKPKKK